MLHILQLILSTCVTDAGRNSQPIRCLLTSSMYTAQPSTTMHNTQCLIQPEIDTRSTELPNEGATLYASDLRASALPPLLLAYASASASALDLPPLLEAEASADASADTIQRQIYVSAHGW